VPDDQRLKRTKVHTPEGEKIEYVFHVEIVVSSPAVSEKRLRQLIDERFALLAMTLGHRTG
jgi:hypothetical protein